MADWLFSILELIDNNLWQFVGFPLILFVGLVFSIRSRFVQIRKLPVAFRNFKYFLFHARSDERGVHPIKALFASIGGCIGIGNVVAICTAVQIGGPGAVFWLWVTSILGTMFKYAEVYLGMRYRVKNSVGSYDGGPMYFLQHAFKAKWIPYAVSTLICIYGVEVYQFSIVSHSISHNFDLNQTIVAFVLLALVIYAGIGGVKRVGEISTLIMPLFIVIYLAMGSWVLFQNLSAIPEMFSLIFSTAFTGSGAMGGFVGSTLMMAISQGVRRGCYTQDVGVGYAAIIHSESATKSPERQASLTFVEIFLDSFMICTMSLFLVLITGVWQQDVHESTLVQTALGMYFPYMNVFMPVFIFLLGYTTINSYFCAGLKCAAFLSPRFGKYIFLAFAGPFLFLFTFFTSKEAILMMSLVQVLLLMFNAVGIYRLRKEVSFNIVAAEEEEKLLVRET